MIAAVMHAGLSREESRNAVTHHDRQELLFASDGLRALVPVQSESGSAEPVPSASILAPDADFAVAESESAHAEADRVTDLRYQCRYAGSEPADSASNTMPFGAP